uniref:Uncharacterized protein n=1 Tax=Rhizophora mucronata TaxID=61149 RepID=A0A2P2N4J1_RHIMU
MMKASSIYELKIANILEISLKLFHEIFSPLGSQQAKVV